MNIIQLLKLGCSVQVIVEDSITGVITTYNESSSSLEMIYNNQNNRVTITIIDSVSYTTEDITANPVLYMDSGSGAVQITDFASFTSNYALVFDCTSGGGGGGGNQNLQQVLNIGNSAIDKPILLSSSTGNAYELIYNPSLLARSSIYPTFNGVQKTNSDDYIYQRLDGNIPNLIIHNGTAQRESRMYPDYWIFKELVTGAILKIQSPALITTNLINIPNKSGTLALVEDFTTIGIDSVLSVSQAFTNTRGIDCSGFDFSILNVKTFSLQNSSATTLIIDGDEIYTSGTAGLNGLNFNFATNVYQFGGLLTSNLTIDANLSQMSFSIGAAQRLQINANGQSIGDISGLLPLFSINHNNNTIYTIFQNQFIGLYLDFGNNNFYIGNQSTGNYFLVDDNNSNLWGYSNNLISLLSGNAGISLSGNNSLIGDVDGRANQTFFGVDDAHQTLYGSNNLIITGGSHTPTLDHLKININGTDYVIQLLNP